MVFNWPDCPQRVGGTQSTVVCWVSSLKSTRLWVAKQVLCLEKPWQGMWFCPSESKHMWSYSENVLPSSDRRDSKRPHCQSSHNKCFVIVCSCLCCWLQASLPKAILAYISNGNFQIELKTSWGAYIPRAWPKSVYLPMVSWDNNSRLQGWCWPTSYSSIGSRGPHGWLPRNS